MSGPPDYGRGQLDTSRYGEQYASKRVDADRALLPEQTPFYKDLVSLTSVLSFISKIDILLAFGTDGFFIGHHCCPIRCMRRRVCSYK